MVSSPAVHVRARRTCRLTTTLLAAVSFHGSAHATPSSEATPQQSEAAAPAAPVLRASAASTPQLPLIFVPNQGQSPAAVRFQARTLGGAAFFTAHEVVLALPQPRRNAEGPLGGDPRGAALGGDPRGVPVKFVRLRFVGANDAPEVEAAALLPGRVHEMIGADRSRWRSNLPTYGRVVYRNLYPGVDLSYEENGGRLKATYVVAPGVDPSLVRWRYEGAGEARVDAAGNLRVGLSRSRTGAAASAGTELTEHTPAAWQDVAGRRHPVDIRYQIAADGSVGFALPNGYDRTQPLTLDPTLTYSTFLGGSGDDNGYDVAVDAAGAMYVIGRTLSVNFPISNAIDPGCGTDANCDGFAFYDAFIAKLDPGASGAASLLFSTYLGGSANDFGLRIRTRAVSGSVQIYAVGIGRTGFPTTSNAYDQTFGGASGAVGADAFFAVLSGDGSQLSYATFLGGSNGDGGWGLDVDSNGVASIVGQTFSTDFPTVSPFDAACGTDGTCNTDQSDAFVARIDPAVSGSAGLLYATYLGGSGTDQAYGVRRAASGRLHVAGRTPSTDFPTSASPAQAANAVPGGPRPGSCFNFEVECDAFVSVLDPSGGGGGLVYSSYLGGVGYEDAYSLALDSAGNTLVVGSTFSSGFPTTSNAFQPTFGGTNDAYLARFATGASGSASLPYATFLGGADDDQGYGLDVLGTLAHVSGFTRSTDFPVAGNPFQPINGGYWDAFALKLDPTVSGSAGLAYSTYLGGLSTDATYGMAVDATGAMAVAGQSFSVNFPIVNAYQDLPVGGSDVVVARIDTAATSADLIVLQTDAPDPAAVFGEVTYTVLVTNTSGVTATGVRLGDVLSSGTSLASFTPSQGTCRQDFSTGDNDIGCELGSLASGATATVNVVAMPFSEGTISNTARVSSNFGDPDAAGNVSSESTTVSVPQLSINDVSVVEGNSGTTNAAFTVTLAPASTQTVTLEYATANGTATAGSDYTSGAGTLTFDPGMTSRQIVVPVIGDTTVEPNETFFVNLSNPSGANLGDDQGQGTITNDDAAGPSLQVSTTTATPGQTIQVTVSNGPGNATDWVGLHLASASDVAILDWRYLSGTRTPPASGLTNATITFTLPQAPGTYNFRLFASNGYTKLATSPAVTVQAGQTPTLSVSSQTATPGQTITVTVTNGPGSTTDWVGMHGAAGGDTSILDWKYLNGLHTPPGTGLTSATLSFTVPQAPGTYNFRLFANNSYSKIATSPTVTVQAGQAPTLTVSTQTATPGQQVTVTLANGPGATGDWVGLYGTGSADTLVLDWKYLNGLRTPPASGLTGATLTFALPLTPGSYNFRLFANNSYTRLAASLTITVQAAQTPTLTVSSQTAAPGQTITVTLANGPGNVADWVGLHAQSGSDLAPIDWRYLNGLRTPPASGLTDATLSFAMPLTPGSYNFRLFANNSYSKLATSATVTVQ